LVNHAKKQENTPAIFFDYVQRRQSVMITAMLISRTVLRLSTITRTCASAIVAFAVAFHD
jgi:hypothetical protein